MSTFSYSSFSNTVIYVGKAKALKNRVSQYFANLASHTDKTRAMVSSIDHFDVIVARRASMMSCVAPRLP